MITIAPLFITTVTGLLDVVNDFLWTYIVITLLVVCALYFTIRSRGVQFRLLKDVWHVIADRPLFGEVGSNTVAVDAHPEKKKKKIDKYLLKILQKILKFNKKDISILRTKPTNKTFFTFKRKYNL